MGELYGFGVQILRPPLPPLAKGGRIQGFAFILRFQRFKQKRRTFGAEEFG